MHDPEQARWSQASAEGEDLDTQKTNRVDIYSADSREPRSAPPPCPLTLIAAPSGARIHTQPRALYQWSRRTHGKLLQILKLRLETYTTGKRLRKPAQRSDYVPLWVSPLRCKILGAVRKGNPALQGPRS